MYKQIRFDVSVIKKSNTMFFLLDAPEFFSLASPVQCWYSVTWLEQDGHTVILSLWHLLCNKLYIVKISGMNFDWRGVICW